MNATPSIIIINRHIFPFFGTQISMECNDETDMILDFRSTLKKLRSLKRTSWLQERKMAFILLRKIISMFTFINGFMTNIHQTVLFLSKSPSLQNRQHQSRAADIFFFLKEHYLLIRHHLDRIKQNFGQTSPKKSVEQKHYAPFWVKQKGIWIPESAKVLLVETGIQVKESGIQVP